MSAISRLKFLYLACASKPSAERFLYRSIRKNRVSRIVEFGMTSLVRSRRMIEVAQRYAPSGGVSFTGIDPFESLDALTSGRGNPGRSLIDVFRSLKPTGASLRLLPGSISAVLSDAANSLLATDLLLIAHTVDDADLAPVWFYLPRMLHPGSHVYRERLAASDSEIAFAFDVVPLSQIQKLASRRPGVAA